MSSLGHRIEYYTTIVYRNIHNTYTKYHRINPDQSITVVDPARKTIRRQKSFGSEPYHLYKSTKKTFEKIYKATESEIYNP